MEIKLGEEIKEQRKARQITQKELAKQLRVNPTIISKWEKGLKRPIYEDLINLALYFEVSVEYLLGLEDEFGKRR